MVDFLCNKDQTLILKPVLAHSKIMFRKIKITRSGTKYLFPDKLIIYKVEHKFDSYSFLNLLISKRIITAFHFLNLVIYFLFEHV